MRVVVDTNVWVSALLRQDGFAAHVAEAFHKERFAAVVSETLLSELREVMARPRLVQRYGIPAAARDQLLAALRAHASEVDVLPESRIRDPSDLPVVAAAIAGRADAIVTRDADFLGDRDLIAGLADQGIEVLTIQRFLDRLDSLS